MLRSPRLQGRVCVCTSSKLAWHVSSCYPLAGPERQRQRENSSACFQVQMRWAILKIQPWRLVGIWSLSRFTKAATEGWIMHTFVQCVRNIHVTYCADKMHAILRLLDVFFSGLYTLRLRLEKIDFAASFECLNWFRRTPKLVGLVHVRALQPFSYSRFKAIIQFFQGSCKHADCSAWFSWFIYAFWAVN